MKAQQTVINNMRTSVCTPLQRRGCTVSSHKLKAQDLKARVSNRPGLSESSAPGSGPPVQDRTVGNRLKGTAAF